LNRSIRPPLAAARRSCPVYAGWQFEQTSAETASAVERKWKRAPHVEQRTSTSCILGCCVIDSSSGRRGAAWWSLRRLLYKRRRVGGCSLDRARNARHRRRRRGADTREPGRSRRSLRASEPARPGSPISPNLAGRDAAALALAYQVFRRSDPTFANRCLLAAEHIFDLADTAPKTLLTVIPHSFYPETEWRDDLELGATELSDALAAGAPPAGLPHSDPLYFLPNGVVYSGVVSGMRLCPPDGSDPFAQFNSKALYKDDVQSFSTVEPAIDLTATTPLAFARQMAGLY
jgi:Glycosyl hydrolase family 9